VTTYAPATHRHRLHVHPWLVAVIVLAAALVALGAWVLVDQARSSSTQGLASSEVTTMLDARLAALNRFDAEATAAFFTKDAVMEEIEQGAPVVVSSGRKEIANRFRVMLDYSKQTGVQGRTGATTQIGPYVAQTFSWGASGTTEGQGILVFKLDEKGEIAHEWVIVGAP
jgi:hypothetical protein